MILDDRRAVLVGGTAFVACCFCRGALAGEGDKAPRSFDMVAFCCLDCSKCDAYLATIRKDDALRAEVAERWKMKPERDRVPGLQVGEGALQLHAQAVRDQARPEDLRPLPRLRDLQGRAVDPVPDATPFGLTDEGDPRLDRVRRGSRRTASPLAPAP